MPGSVDISRSGCCHESYPDRPFPFNNSLIKHVWTPCDIVSTINEVRFVEASSIVVIITFIAVILSSPVTSRPGAQLETSIVASWTAAPTVVMVTVKQPIVKPLPWCSVIRRARKNWNTPSRWRERDEEVSGQSPRALPVPDERQLQFCYAVL